MSDFERLFALVALVNDPKTAIENAKAMQEVEAARAGNLKQFKELKAEQIAFNREKDELKAGWASVAEAKSAFNKGCVDLDRERKEVKEMKASALGDVKKARAQINALEGDYKKREAELKAGIKKIEAEVLDAKDRKQQAEDELAHVRQLVGA